MSDTTFRTSSPVTTDIPAVSEFKENIIGASNIDNTPEPAEVYEGRTGKDAVLSAMGIEDDIKTLPVEDKENLTEVSSYLKILAKQKGLTPSIDSYRKVLTGLKLDMGMDMDAEPNIVLDRIGGLVKSWKGLAFIKDPAEKRSIFARLARMDSSEAMDKFLFEEMNKKKIWQ